MHRRQGRPERDCKPRIGQGGDDVRGLKDKPGSVPEAVADDFTTAPAAHFKHLKHCYTEGVGQGPGRLEIRRYGVTEDLGPLPHTEVWKRLHNIGHVARECLAGESRGIAHRYFLHSLAADARRFAPGDAVSGASNTACPGGWSGCFGKTRIALPGQRSGPYDGDPSPMPESVTEGAFQPQDPEETPEGRLG
jgi:hypothetical protein